MPIVRFDTAINIVNRAASELKLAPATSVFGSIDPNFVQLRALLTSCGQELALSYEWSHLRSELNFVTANGDTGIYTLPADFMDMVEQTGWDRTRRLPLGGPLSSEEWQYLKAWAVSVSVIAMFRMNQNELWLYPQPPPVGVNIVLEYRSTSWVIPAASPPTNYNTKGAAGQDSAVLDGDICLFDALLLTKMLKFKWLKENGFESGEAQIEYKRILELVEGRNSAAAQLSLKPGPGSAHDRIIDDQNIPITGWNGVH